MPLNFSSMKSLFVVQSRLSLLTLAMISSFGLAHSSAFAQNDLVYTFNSKSPAAGQVTQVTKDGVALKTNGATKAIPATEIRKILFQGDPRELVKGRESAIAGQYEQAVEELTTVDPKTLNRELSKSDAGYYLVLSRGKLALAGRGDKSAAAKAALAFAGSNQNSYHFYSVARLLGDLALALNNHDLALRYYGSLGSAASRELKAESKYLTGMALMAKGAAGEAEKAFDSVLAEKTDTAAVLRIQKLAKAGKAVAMARSGKGDESLTMVNSLIEELSANDVEMGARIYNAQGASFEAMGDKDGAVMAYLHTHLLFSTQPDAHARALSRLVELWPQVGRPERADQARQELQQRYPGFTQ